MSRSTAVLGLVAILTLALGSPTPAADTGESPIQRGTEILRRIDENLVPGNVTFYRKIINVEPDGSRKEFVMYSAKKGDERVASLFLSPPTDRGRTTLRTGDNMWMYVPSVKKPIRITSLQSVTGGIFDNADIMRLDYSYEYRVETFEPGTDTGLDHLTLRARTDAVAYDRLEMWVDPGTLTPTRIDSYTASGMLIKTLRFSKIKDFGNGIVRPSRIVTTSPLQEGYRSVMLFERFEPRDIPDRYFTLNGMKDLDEIR